MTAPEQKKKLIDKYLNPKRKISSRDVTLKMAVSGVEIAVCIITFIAIGYFIGSPYGKFGTMFGLFFGAISGLVFAVKMALRMSV